MEQSYQQKSINRFWSHVNRGGSDECWLWMLPKRMGYGRFSFHGKLLSAHRFSYELKNGKLDSGITLDHLCRNRGCVNPNHLEPVPMKVNVLRGHGPTAINSKKRFCKRGHLLDGRNIYIPPSGGRVCSLCRKQRNKEHPEKKREWDRRYREKHRKNCPLCGVSIRHDSVYCRRHATLVRWM